MAARAKVVSPSIRLGASTTSLAGTDVRNYQVQGASGEDQTSLGRAGTRT